MNDMTLAAGICSRQERIVTDTITAKEIGSGELPVLATPYLIALAEETAWRSVAEYLEEGQGTVGTRIEISHVSATPVGMKIWCESTLTEVDRRRLVFSIKVFDECGLIGEGTHERFIIDNGRFMEKAMNKLK
ncbi:MAG: thioesterase family protein [Solobacterium sp.]|nr:thioesterase family protein [Solobacterium sp.]